MTILPIALLKKHICNEDRYGLTVCPATGEGAGQGKKERGDNKMAEDKNKVNEAVDSIDDKMANKVTEETVAIQSDTEMPTAGANDGTQPRQVTHTLAVRGNKKEYKAGEKIQYEGVTILCDGKDVTPSCSFEPAPGTPYDRSEKSIAATATYVTDNGTSSSVAFELRRKGNRLVPLFVCLGVIVASLAAIVVANPDVMASLFGKKEDDTGAYLIPKGDMTDEEAQALVNEMAAKSRITINLAPNMRISDEKGLRVNFIVPEGNNGLSERLEVTQGDKVIAKTGIIEPGYMVEWIEVDRQPEEGPAVATVYAVSDESDTGNPVSVEVQIVGPDFVAEPVE